MKITKVTYQKTYSIGPYLTDRVGMEADVDENDVVADVLDNLRAKADQWHKAEHPHLYQEQERGFGDLPEHLKTKVEFAAAPPVINIQDERNADVKADILKAIQTADTLEELKTYKTLASSDPTKTLYTAYCERLKKLTNGPEKD